MQFTPEEITQLSPQDRLILIGQLWDSLDDASVHVTPAQQTELTRRLATFEEDRGQGVSWDTLKDELAKRCP
jgi:putative addiction module component (TIGR02574 family)